MNDFILLLFLVWFILYIGFNTNPVTKKKDYGIVAMGGLFMIMLGIYPVISYTGLNGYLNSIISIFHTALGFYIVVRSSVELNKVETDEGLKNKIRKFLGLKKKGRKN